MQGFCGNFFGTGGVDFPENLMDLESKGLEGWGNFR